MNAAIYFDPEGYTTTGVKLMGRNAAGESFLRGFLKFSRANEFWAIVTKKEHGKVFADTVKSVYKDQAIRIILNHQYPTLSQVGTIYYPGPGIFTEAWKRALFGHGKWSICGITHTTASAKAMDAITGLLTAPVQPWDAVICTSTAVKDNVSRLLKAEADFLKQRFSAQKLVIPQLPIIPLGIHTSDFIYTAEQKAAARKVLGADEQSIVVLFMGRLSFHAKAHPLAMYQALEKAATGLPTDKKIILVECGWHASDYIKKAYTEAAAMACPSVRIVTLDGRKRENRQTAWAGADLFCSLSDNIQETFGIVPIEAMAAGLPVVVADWDGYKDTVRDTIDGFRIPTLMPVAGFGNTLAKRHALGVDTYDRYCGYTCSFAAIDIEAAAKAFSRLFVSSELRAKMGEAGRSRAKEIYDWQFIIPQYESLWYQLREIRTRHAKDLQPLAQPWPARMDPFHAFASYPTKSLTLQTVLGLVDNTADAAAQRLAEYRQLTMINFADVVLPSQDEVKTILEVAASGPCQAKKILAGIPPARQAFMLRSLAWLLKLGILKIC